MPLPMGGKRIDPVQLSAELTAAGVTHRGLGTNGDDLYTFTAGGVPTDLPAGAAAVVTAHVPPALPAPIDFGSDLQTDTEIKAQAAAVVSGLRTYLGLATPTLPQSVLALKAVIRVLLFLIRRQFPDL